MAIHLALNSFLNCILEIEAGAGNNVSCRSISVDDGSFFLKVGLCIFLKSAEDRSMKPRLGI